MGSLAERFFARFTGLERGHGRHHPGSAKNAAKNGKIEGSSEHIHRPYTVDLWDMHLEGTYSLGVVPIRDDATVRWGALDIDVYDKDLVTLAKLLVKREVPLTITRTKSGGGHLWLFLNEDAPAEIVRARLMEWAVALGHSGVEVFPKQTRLASKEDYGNWINMPYFDAYHETSRYCILANGKHPSAEEFLDIAEQAALSLVELKGIEVAAFDSPDQANEWYEAPPCLQTLAIRGFEEGGRNNALFNIAIYLRKRYGDDAWEQHLDEYNSKYMDPPLSSAEVVKTIASVKKKVYDYTSEQPPLVQVCNKAVCLTRQFGKGQGPRDPGVLFGKLVKRRTEPTTWFWEVNGARIELTTQELMAQPRFNQRCVEELNVWPTLLKPQQWNELVREKLAECEVQEVHESETDEGIVWDYLQQYITRSKSKTREEVALDKAWTDPDDDRTYFRATDFRRWLLSNHIRIDQKKLANYLRKHDCRQGDWNIKGKHITWWSVPKFSEQTADFDLPEMGQEAL